MKLFIIGALSHGEMTQSFYDAFQRCGVTVSGIDDMATFRRTPFASNRYFARLFRIPFALKMNNEILRVVKKVRPDLVFITKGQWIHPDTIKSMQAKDALVFNYFPDSE